MKFDQPSEKNKRVLVRFTEPEHEHLQELAKKYAQGNVSRLIRMALDQFQERKSGK